VHLSVTHGTSLESVRFLADQYPEAVLAEYRDGHGGVVLHAVVAGGYPTPDAVRVGIRHDPGSVRALNDVNRAPIHVAVCYSTRCSSDLVFVVVQILAELAPEVLRIHDTYGNICTSC
jgi:hypothetical protein